MKITRDTSDAAVLQELGNRVARYRLNTNLSQASFAKEAGISMRTLIRMEHGESTQSIHLIRILRTLQLLENFDAVIPEPAISPLQQLRMQGKNRRRASPKPEKPVSKKPWSWGDGE